MPTIEPEVNRFTLPNGLRVLMLPNRADPVVGVGVHYDVGFRSEPQGFAGFAHLFEHLMFQGSESLEKLDHFRYVQGSGGACNASTRPDYTSYFSVLPSAGLERALFLEADRMRAPKLTRDNLDNQIEVVKQEIRQNVTNRPYGGIPWIHLPPLMYQKFANAHNGYGDFRNLEAACVDDCAAFFEQYYSPSNALLTVVGDIDCARTAELVHGHFDDVPARAAPDRPLLTESPPTRENHDEFTDEYAKFPALVVGYRLPDPARDMEGYLAYLLVTSLLCGNDSSRLCQRLIHQEGLVTAADSACGLFGDPLVARDPDTLTVVITYPRVENSERILAVLDEELDRLATTGPEPAEMHRHAACWAAKIHRDVDRPNLRLLSHGVFELLYGRTELTWELPERIRAVPAERIKEAADSLRPHERAVLHVRPTQVSAVVDSTAE